MNKYSPSPDNKEQEDFKVVDIVLVAGILTLSVIIISVILITIGIAING